MANGSIVDTLAQALAQDETIGMPACNLAARTRHEYSRDLQDVLGYRIPTVFQSKRAQYVSHT